MTEVKSWQEAMESFDDSINESWGEVRLAGLTFQPSEILRELDPIAYRTYLLDYLDSEGIDSDSLTGELDV